MKDLKKFLRESNAIEGVYSEQCLEDAVSAWDYLFAQDKLDPRVVKTTHSLLMKSREAWDEVASKDWIGKFREFDVWVGGQKGANPAVVPQLVTHWCMEVMRGKKTSWQGLHVAYEKIHPFVDGNGRTGRMFMNWHRVKLLGLPILVIKEAEKHEYYKWFI